jgi:hypothetical protein
LGWHTEKYNYKYQKAVRKKFPNNELTDMNAGDASTQSNEGYTAELAMISWFARINYDFAGFFPSDDPKYSIIVVLYTNKTRANFYGGAWAAPVFKQVADYIFINSRGWTSPIEGNGKSISQTPYILGGSRLATESILSALNHKNVELPKADWIRESSDSTGKHLCGVSIIKDTMPDLSNMGIRDALYLMENLGYRIKFTGKGKVVTQDPAPGTFIDKKTTIQLQLADSYETKQDSK